VTRREGCPQLGAWAEAGGAGRGAASSAAADKLAAPAVPHELRLPTSAGVPCTAGGAGGAALAAAAAVCAAAFAGPGTPGASGPPRQGDAPRPALLVACCAAACAALAAAMAAALAAAWAGGRRLMPMMGPRWRWCGGWGGATGGSGACGASAGTRGTDADGVACAGRGTELPCCCCEAPRPPALAAAVPLAAPSARRRRRSSARGSLSPSATRRRLRGGALAGSTASARQGAAWGLGAGQESQPTNTCCAPCVGLSPASSTPYANVSSSQAAR
jgi:hypothetical protein